MLIGILEFSTPLYYKTQQHVAMSVAATGSAVTSPLADVRHAACLEYAGKTQTTKTNNSIDTNLVSCTSAPATAILLMGRCTICCAFHDGDGMWTDVFAAPVLCT